MDLTEHYLEKILSETSLNESIYLYGDGIGRVEYVQHMGTDKTIVDAARVSFGKKGNEKLTEKDEKLIRYLIKNKHVSTLEHNVLTFRFTVPLFVRSQHHRHRTWSYNEESGRYLLAKDQFYLRKQFGKQDKTNKQGTDFEKLINPKITYLGEKLNVSEAIQKNMENSLSLYEEIIGEGISKEQARAVMPLAKYTNYIGTVNLNNLLKFINLRIDEHAQWEIQQVAKACLAYANLLWPKAIKNYMEIERTNQK